MNGGLLKSSLSISHVVAACVRMFDPTFNSKRQGSISAAIKELAMSCHLLTGSPFGPSKPIGPYRRTIKNG